MRQDTLIIGAAGRQDRAVRCIAGVVFTLCLGALFWVGVAWIARSFLLATMFAPH